MEMFVSTSSITMSSLPVVARSWECSVMTCKALVIMFSASSVLPEDSLSMAFRRGKQKEKAGADSGATSKKKKQCRRYKGTVDMCHHSHLLTQLLATVLTSYWNYILNENQLHMHICLFCTAKKQLQSHIVFYFNLSFLAHHYLLKYQREVV